MDIIIMIDGARRRTWRSDIVPAATNMSRQHHGQNDRSSYRSSLPLSPFVLENLKAEEFSALSPKC